MPGMKKFEDDAAAEVSFSTRTFFLNAMFAAARTLRPSAVLRTGCYAVC